MAQRRCAGGEAAARLAAALTDRSRTAGGAPRSVLTADELGEQLEALHRCFDARVPAVVHVTHGVTSHDHDPLLRTRSSGWTTWVSATAQEAVDLGVVSAAAAATTRLPALHLLDLPCAGVPDEAEAIATLARTAPLDGHRHGPGAPDLDAAALVAAARSAGHELAHRTGRRHGLVSYHGAPDAERVVVLAGAATGTVRKVVHHLADQGERVGVVQVRLVRPFPTQPFLDALPATVLRLAVLDRTSSVGALEAPLRADVLAALADAVGDGRWHRLPSVIEGRYGVGGAAFTPAMAASVLDELHRFHPRRRVTVGLPDVGDGSALRPDPTFALAG